MLVMGTRSLGKSVVQSVVSRAEEIIHSCSIVSDDGSKSKTYSVTHTVNIIDYVMILWQIASRKSRAQLNAVVKTAVNVVA
jgi:hypothetical protein